MAYSRCDYNNMPITSWGYMDAQVKNKRAFNQESIALISFIGDVGVVKTNGSKEGEKKCSAYTSIMKVTDKFVQDRISDGKSEGSVRWEDNLLQTHLRGRDQQYQDKSHTFSVIEGGKRFRVPFNFNSKEYSDLYTSSDIDKFLNSGMMGSSIFHYTLSSSETPKARIDALDNVVSDIIAGNIPSTDTTNSNALIPNVIKAFKILVSNPMCADYSTIDLIERPSKAPYNNWEAVTANRASLFSMEGSCYKGVGVHLDLESLANGYLFDFGKHLTKDERSTYLMISSKNEATFFETSIVIDKLPKKYLSESALNTALSSDTSKKILKISAADFSKYMQAYSSVINGGFSTLSTSLNFINGYPHEAIDRLTNIPETLDFVYMNSGRGVTVFSGDNTGASFREIEMGYDVIYTQDNYVNPDLSTSDKINANAKKYHPFTPNKDGPFKGRMPEIIERIESSFKEEASSGSSSSSTSGDGASAGTDNADFSMGMSFGTTVLTSISVCYIFQLVSSIYF